MNRKFIRTRGLKGLLRWKDLTRYQKALLREYRKDGILLSPDQAVKMTGQQYYRPRAKSITALHILAEDEHGHVEPFLESRRTEIDLYHRRTANPDFITFWKQRNMSAAINLQKGYISLAAHGGIHFTKQELRLYDIENLLSAFIGAYYTKQGKVPKRMKFTRKIRERAMEIVSILAIAKANQAQTGTRQGPVRSTKTRRAYHGQRH